MNTGGVDAAQTVSSSLNSPSMCILPCVQQTTPAGVALCGRCLCKGFGEFCQVFLAWKVESGNPANPSYSHVVHRRGYMGTPPGHDGEPGVNSRGVFITPHVENRILEQSQLLCQVRGFSSE